MHKSHIKTIRKTTGSIIKQCQMTEMYCMCHYFLFPSFPTSHRYFCRVKLESKFTFFEKMDLKLLVQ